MQPVRTTSSVVDYVASVVCARVASGEIEAADVGKLEQTLCRDLRVAHSTVRAAIQVLEVAEANGDAERIATVLSATEDFSSVATVQSWRRRLLALFVREAVRTAATEDFDVLTLFADEFEVIPFREPVKLLEADLAFHQRLALAGGRSMLLLLILNALHAAILQNRTQFLRIHPPREQLTKYHRWMIQALTARDANECQKALDYYFIVHRALQPVLSPHRRRSSVGLPDSSLRIAQAVEARRDLPPARANDQQAGVGEVSLVERTNNAEVGSTTMATSDSMQELWNAMAIVRKGLEQLERAMGGILQDAALGQAVRAAIANPSNLPKPTSASVEHKTGAPPPTQVVKAKRGRTARRSFGAAAAKAADDILGALKDRENGLNLKELAAATGLRSEAVSYRLGVLRRAKKVRMEGKKSSARYFLAA